MEFAELRSSCPSFDSALENHYLGTLYRQGLEVRQYQPTAAFFFQLGINAGDSGALIRLGNCYSSEFGVEKILKSFSYNEFYLSVMLPIYAL